MNWHHRNPSAFSLPAAIAAADHAATERACAIVCPMCANIDWMPAYKSKAGAWLHQSGHPGRQAVICVAAGIREAARVTSEIVKMLDETNSPAASAIREAAEKAKAQP